MKRIGIYTYYNVHNHGALLQAYALSKVISSISKNDEYHVNFIKFDRDYSYIEENQKSKYKISFDSIKFYVRYIFNKGIGSFFFNFKKNRLLNAFRRKQFSFVENLSECDLCLSGSDEVFSVEVGFNRCMYGINEDKPFISYAASFGPTTMNELKSKELDKTIAEGLKKFRYISTRDENSLKIASILTNRKDIVMSCDPVLLYGYHSEIGSFPLRKEKYVLVYSYDKNLNAKEEYKEILEFAKKNNFKVYSVGFYHKWADKCINVDPLRIFDYFKSAQLVVTDTFHGSVLSIVCNTQFVTKIRGNSNKVEFLLNQYELSSRITKDFSNLDLLFTNKIDYRRINDIVEKYRKQSFDYLVEALK